MGALGSFMCVIQHTGPAALRPIRRKIIWNCVLLSNETSVTFHRVIALNVKSEPTCPGVMARSGRLNDTITDPILLNVNVHLTGGKQKTQIVLHF